MRKAVGLRGIVSMAAGLSAVLGAGAFVAAAPPGTPQQPTVVVSFDPALAQLPESMTSDNDGNLFASNFSGAIQKIDPQASTFVTVATVPLPTGAVLTGIKIGPDGLIYVASASFSPTPAGAFLWRVSPSTGAVEQFATLDPNGFPNDLVFQDDGSIILTDPFLAQLWTIDTTGQASVFRADPLFAGDPVAPAFSGLPFGIDGIAWDHNKRNLIVSNLDFGRVMNIPMDLPGTRQSRSSSRIRRSKGSTDRGRSPRDDLVRSEPAGSDRHRRQGRRDPGDRPGPAARRPLQLRLRDRRPRQEDALHRELRHRPLPGRPGRAPGHSVDAGTGPRPSAPLTGRALKQRDLQVQTSRVILLVDPPPLFPRLGFGFGD